MSKRIRNLLILIQSNYFLYYVRYFDHDIYNLILFFVKVFIELFFYDIIFYALGPFCCILITLFA